MNIGMALIMMVLLASCNDDSSKRTRTKKNTKAADAGHSAPGDEPLSQGEGDKDNHSADTHKSDGESADEQDGAETDTEGGPGETGGGDPAEQSDLSPATFSLKDSPGGGVDIRIANAKNGLTYLVCRGTTSAEVKDRSQCQVKKISDWLTSTQFADKDPLYLQQAFYNVMVRDGHGSTAIGQPIAITANGGIRLEVGSDSICALDAKARLYCWGQNAYGQLGLGHKNSVASPTRVGDGTWKAVAQNKHGTLHPIVFAVSGDGGLYRWGRGTYWKTVVTSPLRIGSKSDWVDVQFSLGHACAVDQGGDVYCLGANGYGAIAATTSPALYDEPTLMPNVKWDELTVGVITNWLISDQGKLSVWGGVISGYTAVTRQNTPVMIGNDSGWTQIADTHWSACGIRAEQLYCWGANYHAKFGVANTASYVPAPEKVLFELPVKSVSVDYYSFCLTTTNLSAYCWGTNYQGSVGDGTTVARTSPTKVQGDHKWLFLDTTNHRTCGIVENGDIYCFGRPLSGQMQLTPQKVGFNIFGR